MSLLQKFTGGFILLFLFSAFPLLAQRSKLPDSVFCKAPSLTTTERQELERMIDFAFRLKKAAGQTTAITYVPVRPHIYRRADGTGGMTLNSLNNVLAYVNKYYLNNGSGIQFYFCGTAPDYINNDQIYTNGFPSSTSDESSANGRDAINAMNLYLVNTFDESGLLGYAYFPNNTLRSTRSFIRTSALTDSYIGTYVMAHEFGHTFSLYHTFDGSTGANPELVTRSTGANCTTAGDLLCDTPADPYGRTGATTSSQSGCLVYTGTITDSQGNGYAPSMGNIMSYYDGCNPEFTAGQYARVQGGLALRQSHSAYSLTCAPTTVAMPTNVSATANGLGVILTWQDNANNELGYFIERSTSANTGFEPIGGVAPNTTSFSDGTAASQSVYYYRLRPSNSTTAGLTTPVSVSVGAITCKPTFVYGCVDEDGLDSFVLNGIPLSTSSGCSPSSYRYTPTSSVTVTPGQSYSLGGVFLGATYAEGAAIWLDLDRNGVYDASERVFQMNAAAKGSFTGSLSIAANTAPGLLPMRIIVRYNGVPTNPCGSYLYGEAEDYVLTVAGTCSVPTGLTTLDPGSTTAVVSWSAVAGVASYSLSWQPTSSTGIGSVGVSSVTTSASSFTLSGLLPSTTYTVLLRSVCTGDQVSLPTNLTLTTAPCSVMYTLKAGDWTDPTVWSCNRVPTTADAVVINHSLTIPVVETAGAQKITYGVGGSIRYEEGARLQLGEP